MAWIIRIGPRDEGDQTIEYREVRVRTKREAETMVNELTDGQTLAYAVKAGSILDD